MTFFSPATSGHVLKLLPTVFTQRVSDEEHFFSDARLPRCERRSLASSTGETSERKSERRRLLGEKTLTWTESWSKSMV